MGYRDSALVLCISFAALVISAAAPARAAAQGEVTLLNVSYDPTRELYQELNAGFARYWKARPARPSPCGSRTAARASRRAR